MMHKLTRAAFAMLAVLMLAVAGFAADPGLDLPNDPTLRAASQPSDQKKGSVLVYNLYSSAAAGGAANNTRINITNTNANNPVSVHLFFVEGSTCTVADSFICLTANQTASFLASDIDPGTVGYILAVASDSNGTPSAFDYLIGDEYVKLDTGHAANLGAEAISVSILPLLVFPVTGTNGALVRLEFDGICYNQLPRVLAVDNIPSRADGNDTLVVINRIGGNYATGANTIGSIFGLMFDDSETPLSYSIASGACQFRASLAGNVPRITPRIETFIPAGRSGWTKFWGTTTRDNSGFGGGSAELPALFGAVLNRNTTSATVSNAFNGGHNLHKLTLNPFTSIAIPIFPPGC
jgi:hypothetical protein